MNKIKKLYLLGIFISFIIILIILILKINSGIYFTNPPTEGKMFIKNLSRAVKDYFQETNDYKLEAVIENLDGIEEKIGKSLLYKDNGEIDDDIRYFEASFLTKEFIVKKNNTLQTVGPILNKEYNNYFVNYKFIKNKIIDSIYFEKYKTPEYKSIKNYNNSFKIFIVVNNGENLSVDIFITDLNDLIWDSKNKKTKNILMKIPIEMETY